MIALFHFIRPFWFLALLPLAMFAAGLAWRAPVAHAWSGVCDHHLLPFLMEVDGRAKRARPQLLLMASALFMIISLAGPTWSRLATPTFQKKQARVVLLDLSTDMLVRDLSPDRLSRAKFKLHDLFQHQDAGQLGLVVYTSEPFVVSPLTEDGQTIDALLPSLTPEIMPVEGHDLDRALDEGAQLIQQAGFQSGQILVLTARAPSPAAIHTAKALAKNGMYTSIIPVRDTQASMPAFKQLASAGKGRVIALQDTDADLNQWLTLSNQSPSYTENQQLFPVWRDQGRWFLIPALLFLLPAFRRGWLQRLKP